MGAVTKQLPGCTVFCPNEFKEVYHHLEGVGSTVGLGTISSLVQRRPRIANLAHRPSGLEYLKPLYLWKPSRIIDLWCPGYVHETGTEGDLLYSRPQLFCLAAGLSPMDARPSWTVRPDEKAIALNHLDRIGIKPGSFIALATRGTCSTRSCSVKQATSITNRLVRFRPVLHLDCIVPRFKLPPGAGYCLTPFAVTAALVDMAELVVTVDTSIFHLAAAVNTPALAMLGTTDKVVAASYPLAKTVSGSSVTCPLPCNYSHGKGWPQVVKWYGNYCRRHGCSRMRALDMDEVESVALEMLQDAS